MGSAVCNGSHSGNDACRYRSENNGRSWRDNAEGRYSCTNFHRSFIGGVCRAVIEVDGRRRVAGRGLQGEFPFRSRLHVLIAMNLAACFVWLFMMVQNSFDVCRLTADHEAGPDAVAFGVVGRMAMTLLNMASKMSMILSGIGDARGHQCGPCSQGGSQAYYRGQRHRLVHLSTPMWS